MSKPSVYFLQTAPGFFEHVPVQTTIKQNSFDIFQNIWIPISYSFFQWFYSFSNYGFPIIWIPQFCESFSVFPMIVLVHWNPTTILWFQPLDPNNDPKRRAGPRDVGSGHWSGPEASWPNFLWELPWDFLAEKCGTCGKSMGKWSANDENRLVCWFTGGKFVHNGTTVSLDLRQHCLKASRELVNWRIIVALFNMEVTASQSFKA